MTKVNFLNRIQQAACMTGSAASVAWEAAVKTDDNDPRWRDVDNNEDRSQMMISFSKAFGVELPKQAPRKQSRTMVERLEEKLENLKASLEEADEKTKEQIEQSITRTENQLERERKVEEKENAFMARMAKL